MSAHAVDEQGALLVSMTEAAPDCADLVVPGWPGPTIHAVATDVSGVAHPGRVRGAVHLSGTGEVLADEMGLVLREYIGTCRRDLRVPFPSAVRCGCEATRALRDLLAVVGTRG